VERIITGSAGLIFKGEGFYVNDYGNGSAASNGSNGADSADANGSEASTDDSSSTAEAKPSADAD
jgi:predicted nucleic acid-binding Zn ribbon protein